MNQKPSIYWSFRVLAMGVLTLASVTGWAQAPILKLATFDVDATPPVGSYLAYDPVKRVDELGLRCRGIVLVGAGEPIVLCAVDWIGIGNEGQDAFRDALAQAAGTRPNRVAVHTVHQHDAPACDFSAERLLKEAGATNLLRYDGTFAREVIRRTASAITTGLRHATNVTHAGFGEGLVREVASNRRIKGADGRIRAGRMTATKDPALRAEPEGVIDPVVSLLSFWNGDKPLAVLSYYACHPQSYYRMGIPCPDFPGIARFIRGQAVPEALHVHFNGAGGNLGAGKYNDGARTNRMTLAWKLAEGMKEAYENTQRFELAANQVNWEMEPVALPVSTNLNESTLRSGMLTNVTLGPIGLVEDLAWLLRCKAGHKVNLGCLSIGQVRVLFMPGELFVEYQLSAKKMRPDLHVAMAAYGEYGPGYIGTAAAYAEGGYETSARASQVSPDVEPVLMDGMRKLLGVR